MSALRNTVNNWLQKYNKNILEIPTISKLSSEDSKILDIGYDDKRIINFKIISATGGQIIETSKYVDDNSGHTSKYNGENLKRVHNLYIVADGEDLTEALGRIVTMEYLR
jgi:hypothetical protein